MGRGANSQSTQQHTHTAATRSGDGEDVADVANDDLNDTDDTAGA